MADQPCNTCHNYDPIIRGVSEGRHGRCAAKSTYPHKEQRGQVFPPNVKREPPGALAKPHIVVGDDVVPACGLYRIKAKVLPTKKKPS